MGTSELTFGAWRKSTHSGGNSNCVEVAWRKATYSGGNSSCVEVAHTPDTVGVRDSKNPDSGLLTVPRTTWLTFLATLR
ncbi:DUF397 domain-containing protein [Actinosynnema sp. CS-041913]|uniref:DUF397 domain-containing protein n=1 Tax=Actinosynnema sp. CS-041913 TaxID=3239917 RepID=UPI003D8C6BD2